MSRVNTRNSKEMLKEEEEEKEKTRSAVQLPMLIWVARAAPRSGGAQTPTERIFPPRTRSNSILGLDSEEKDDRDGAEKRATRMNRQ